MTIRDLSSGKEVTGVLSKGDRGRNRARKVCSYMVGNAVAPIPAADFRAGADHASEWSCTLGKDN